ncbi:MAG: isoleucyl-tRNA synthetase [Parcubacteria group bacterium Athens1014_26]|nr:MAG: isoleucyl-tRNA synthetase [Parcubacteria group bacterium Athens1014_26]
MPEIEEKVLKFWKTNRIFEKSVEQRSKAKIFSFYDGPPFANNLPHYGHILATTIKDTVTRFWTMMGFKVERRVGWDCHGLPVENAIEKEFELKDKKAIEEMGVEKFNSACRTSVFRYIDNWEKTLQRVGRWADYSKSYATQDNTYMESVWWVFKKLWEQKLVYSDYRITPYCWRCGTPLSNFEVNQGYKETEDPSVFVKFKVKSEKFKEPTYFLVWTTTPWTLTANAALAVGKDIDYVEINHLSDFSNIKSLKIISERRSGGVLQESSVMMPCKYILAKDRLRAVFPNHNYTVEKEFKGKELVGLDYEPLYNFVKSDKKAYFVIAADFVSTEDGTGIVHIAPAFGADDMEVGKKNNLPVILTVDEEGKFKKEVKPWQGKRVKEKDKQISEADDAVLKDLKDRKLLFKWGKIKHQYPFCWRCDSPLLYYPIDSWYVRVSKFRDKLVKNNKKIHWSPEHIKEGRFGKWLSEARDWAISRNRFWGAALPIWKCKKCEHTVAIGSLKELSKRANHSGNKYFIARHGESDANEQGFIFCAPEKRDVKLTKKGRTQVKKTAIQLKRKKIDMIFYSPIKRTKETAEIIACELGLKAKADERLIEYNVGIFNGGGVEKFREFIGSDEMNKFRKIPEKGENFNDIRKRMMDFILEMESNYKDKNILIISHGDPLWVLRTAAKGMSDEQIINFGDYIKTGEWREMEFWNLPYDKNGKLDMHRPFIDGIKLKCEKCNGEAERVEQVFDCWFESGSMPYAQWHYPFENKKLVEKTFPADFIAEGLDQTRGWFYTLHVLATALTLKDVGLGKGKPAFKNVIVNGLVLDEKGVKLSKKLRNYTEPEILMNKLGADAMRYFLLGSTTMGEDYRFSDKGVEEIKRKVIDRIINSYNFYNLYADKSAPEIKYEDLGVLDKWILARLSQTTSEMTVGMKDYNLTDPTRAMISFLDDLSNWYIRRSRKRLQKPEDKKDYERVSRVLRDVLVEVSKLTAPFSPFIAEALYKSLEEKVRESVHLEDWSKADNKFLDSELLGKMEEVRKFASLALALRAEKKIKVRQPLRELRIKNKELGINDKGLLELLKDEVNVKEIKFDSGLEKEVDLDFEITPELKAEGVVRDFIRVIQGLRQDAGYVPKDKILLAVEAEGEIKNILVSNEVLIKKEVGAGILEFKRADKFDAEEDIEIDGQKIWVRVRKI